MKKFGYALLALALVAVVFGGISEVGKAQEGRVYKVGTVQWIGWSAAHVAEAKGFFKEAGVDVKVFNFNSNQEVHAAIKGKRIDLGFDMIGTIVGLYMNGEPVKILAETDWSHGGDKIIVKKGVDLGAKKGSAMGVYIQAPSIEYFLNLYLSQHGQKISDFKVAEMDPEILSDNFIAGRLPVIVNYDPQALRAEREGDGEVAATSATYPGCIPEGMFARTDVLAEIPPEDLVKIIKGYVKAAEWLNQSANWGEYQKVLNEKTFSNDADYSEKDLKEMLDSVKIHGSAELLERNKQGGGLDQYLTGLKAFLASNGMLKKDFDGKTLVDTGALTKALGN